MSKRDARCAQLNRPLGISVLRAVLTAFVALFATMAHADSSGGKFLTLLGFTLNESTLLDVKVKLGFAQEFEVPGGHHESAVCYSTKGSTAIVAFSTDGEFGGPEKLLLGVRVRAANPEKWPCASTSIGAAELALDGLQLGMKEARARDLLAEPTQDLRNGVLKHIFESTRELTAAEATRVAPADRAVMDVTHTVWTVITKGTVSEYGAWFVETY